MQCALHQLSHRSSDCGTVRITYDATDSQPHKEPNSSTDTKPNCVSYGRAFCFSNSLPNRQTHVEPNSPAYTKPDSITNASPFCFSDPFPNC